MIVLDSQKAFDTVDNTIVHMKRFFFFMKLQASVIGNDSLTWFKFVSDGQQLVDWLVLILLLLRVLIVSP
jgi:hypothetical protein